MHHDDESCGKHMEIIAWTDNYVEQEDHCSNNSCTECQHHEHNYCKHEVIMLHNEYVPHSMENNIIDLTQSIEVSLCVAGHSHQLLRSLGWTPRIPPPLEFPPFSNLFTSSFRC